MTSLAISQEIQTEHFPVLQINQEKKLDCSDIVKLSICTFTKLSSLPFYRDSFFSVRQSWPDYFVTRKKLDQPQTLTQDELKLSIEALQPVDCHFKDSDIFKIGKLALGLRHVSSLEEVERETTFGMRNGCSLNISFQKNESRQIAKFTGLPKKIQSNKEVGLALMQEYEKAIDSFIKASIEMDITPSSSGGTVEDLLNTMEKTHFMVLEYLFFSPTDTNRFEGLGRFPKLSVKKDNITRLNKPDILSSISDDLKKTHAFDYDAIVNLMVSHYRKSLLDHLRKLSHN